MAHGGMLGELSGVPQPALQIVFGKRLGRRIWQEARRLSAPEIDSQVIPAVAQHPSWPEAKCASAFLRQAWTWLARLSETANTRGRVADNEIVDGMIAYLSRRSAETLQGGGRQAKTIGLRVAFADGTSRMERARLARPTNEAQELLDAAMELRGRLEARGVTVISVDLTVTSLHAERVSERVNGLEYAMTAVRAV